MRLWESWNATLWPGNVRQLKNVLKRVVTLCEGTTIGINDLPEKVVLNQEVQDDAGTFVSRRNKIVADFESRYFRSLIERHRRNVRSAAREAGIPLSSFYRFLKKHSIQH